MRLGHQARLNAVREQENRVGEGEAAEVGLAQAPREQHHRHEIRGRDGHLIGDGPGRAAQGRTDEAPARFATGFSLQTVQAVERAHPNPLDNYQSS